MSVFFKDKETGKIIADEDFTFSIREAQILEKTIEHVQFLAYGVVTSESGEYTLFLGSPIVSFPSTIENVGETDYLVLTYKKGDVFSKLPVTLKDSLYIEEFFKILSTGKLPEDIPIEHWYLIPRYIINNNQPLDIADKQLDIMFSAVFRSKKDPTKLFRMSSDKDYISMSSRELVSQTSTFASATFEDPIAMMMININKQESEEAFSPLEKYARL